MRALPWVVTCLLLTACFDFEAELNACDAGQGPCARDAGAASGGGGGTTGGGGGSSTGGGGGGGVLPDGGADCADDVGATLQSPDGSVVFCFNGFTWDNPRPHGVDLQTVWGAAPDDVWAAGAAGLLMHWDGVRWTSHQGEIGKAGFGDPLGTIASIVSAPDGVWLGGEFLYPHHLDDAGVWVPLSANPGTSEAWRLAALAVSPDGTRGPYAASQFGAIYGPDWKALSASSPTDYVRSLVVADDGLVAYSAIYSAGSRSWHRVVNVDGGRWSFDAGDPGPLWSEHGQVLVTSTNRDDPSVTLWVLHDDGGATPRATLSQDLVFTAASFLPAFDAGLLVGSRGVIADTRGTILSGGDETYELRGVWASAAGGSWAVGTGGALLRRESSLWVRRQQGFNTDLFAIWMAADGGFFFSGRESLITDRATWGRITAGSGALRDLHGLRDGGWLVASEDGTVYGFNNRVIAGAPGNHSLTGLIVDDEEAWAVGQETVLHRGRDGGWALELPPGSASGQDWWKGARAGSRILVAGNQGAVAVYTLDAGWADPVAREPSTNFYGIWPIDESSAWVVGGGPAIRRFDVSNGSFASAEMLPPSLYGALYDVWGSAPDDVWAVGDYGMAFHYDGLSWTHVETGTRTMLERVRSRPLPGGGRELVIVGEKGTVLHKRY